MILMPARAGFRRVGASGAAAPSHSLTWRSRMSANPASTSQGFSSLAIGTANANRLVIVAAYAVCAASASELSFDISGTSANNRASNSFNNRLIAIASATIPTGTTATITASTDQTMNNLELGYWTAILSAGEDGFDGNFNTANAISVSQTITYPPTSGFAVALCIENSNAADQTQAIDKGFVEQSETYTSAIATNAMYAQLDPALSGIGAVTHTLNASSAQNWIALASFGV